MNARSPILATAQRGGAERSPGGAGRPAPGPESWLRASLAGLLGLAPRIFVVAEALVVVADVRVVLVRG